MPYFNLTTDGDGTPRAVAVQDRYRPGIRLTVGPLYVSMTVAECVDVLEALIAALADLDAEPKALCHGEVGGRDAVETRESLT